jgi:hypothetical protein
MDWKVWASNVSSNKGSILSPNIQTGYSTHPASNSKVFFPGSKVAKA